MDVVSISTNLIANVQTREPTATVRGPVANLRYGQPAKAIGPSRVERPARVDSELKPLNGRIAPMAVVLGRLAVARMQTFGEVER